MGAKEVVVATGALEWPKKTTSRSRLDAREEVLVRDAFKRLNDPPPSRVWTRERIGCVEITKKTNSCSRSDARELVDMAGASKSVKKNHLLLTFGREGGGSSGRRVKMSEKTTCHSRLGAREVAVAAGALRWPKKRTSHSRLDAREVAMVGDVSKHPENFAREVAAVAKPLHPPPKPAPP